MESKILNQKIAEIAASDTSKLKDKIVKAKSIKTKLSEVNHLCRRE